MLFLPGDCGGQRKAHDVSSPRMLRACVPQAAHAAWRTRRASSVGSHGGGHAPEIPDRVQAAGAGKDLGGLPSRSDCCSAAMTHRPSSNAGSVPRTRFSRPRRLFDANNGRNVAAIANFAGLQPIRWRRDVYQKHVRRGRCSRPLRADTKSTPPMLRLVFLTNPCICFTGKK